MPATVHAEQGVPQKIAHQLSQALADTYLLYVKTQNFHWNVTDERFFSLHEMFEKQYQELAEAVDTIAERIRALHVKSPGSMREFLDLSSLEEAPNDLNADEMLQELEKDHRAIAAFMTPLIPEFQKHKDEASADLFIERVRDHEKTAWMLRSHFSTG